MALKGISYNEHARLLWEISNLPYEEAKALEKELEAIYNAYNQQLQELTQAIEVYETLVTKIRSEVVVRKMDILITEAI